MVLIPRWSEPVSRIIVVSGVERKPKLFPVVYPVHVIQPVFSIAFVAHAFQKIDCFVIRANIEITVENNAVLRSGDSTYYGIH